MNCDELLRALNDYVDDETALALCREFAEHLKGCNPCQIVVDNIRQTIQLFRAGKPHPMPPEFEERFRRALRERWKAKFPNSDV